MAQLAIQLAMEEAMCLTHAPLCLLNADGTRAELQPFVYGA